MSQKFVMLFLVSKTQTVTLDTAAKILIEEGQDDSSHSKYKSKTTIVISITFSFYTKATLKCGESERENTLKEVLRQLTHSSQSPLLFVVFSKGTTLV